MNQSFNYFTNKSKNWNRFVIFDFHFTTRLVDWYYLSYFKIDRENTFETDSLSSEAKIGEIMSTIHLKAKQGNSFKEEFFGLLVWIIFLTSIKLVGKNTEVLCNLLVFFFSIGFKDEDGMLFATLLATDEK